MGALRHAVPLLRRRLLAPSEPCRPTHTPFPPPSAFSSISVNYFPHLGKAGGGPASVSQLRVAGAPLMGRTRAPRSSMSDPELLSVRTAVAARDGGPLTAARVDDADDGDARFVDAYARDSWSDPALFLAPDRGRAPVAPGVVVAEGGPAVSTADVPHPLRHSLADPAYADAVRTRLS